MTACLHASIPILSLSKPAIHLPVFVCWQQRSRLCKNDDQTSLLLGPWTSRTMAIQQGVERACGMLVAHEIVALS